jgi:hypothetical protein
VLDEASVAIEIAPDADDGSPGSVPPEQEQEISGFRPIPAAVRVERPTPIPKPDGTETVARGLARDEALKLRAMVGLEWPRAHFRRSGGLRVHLTALCRTFGSRSNMSRSRLAQSLGTCEGSV